MSSIKQLVELGQELKVLYVEDENSLRQSVETYLIKIFKEVKTAKDGQEGLELFKEEEFDIIITDINMPRLNGLDMARVIKTEKPTQKLIIVSAYSNAEYFLESIKLSVDGYILKPINYSQVNDTLYKVSKNIIETKQNIYYQNHLEEMIQEKTLELSNLYKANIENYKETIYSLVQMVEQRDTYTGGHSQRVADYSKLLAKELKLEDDRCDKIYEAGILHDIGKIAIPDNILLKPNKLTEYEYSIIQDHVTIGTMILEKISMFKGIAKIIESHHERYDGSGYPNKLKGENIPLESRIMSIADAFDAMTTNRIYKKKKSIPDAIKEIKNLAGKTFCPEVVKVIDILKDIKISTTISQLPKNHLEEERFSYFYKDQVSGLFNKNYLELVLAKNKEEKLFSHYYEVSLLEFNKYNHDLGWNEGDIFLETFGTYLKKTINQNEIFRVNGVSFIILSKDELNIDYEKISKFLKEHNLSYKAEYLSL